jgi:hypothetical protein
MQAIFGQTGCGVEWLCNVDMSDVEAVWDDYVKSGTYEALFLLPVTKFWQDPTV